MRQPPENKKFMQLLAAELTKDPDFVKALAKELERASYKRELNEYVTELIAVNKVMFARKKTQTRDTGRRLQP